MKFNYISDMHVDNWVLMTNNQVKNENKIREFIQVYLDNTDELFDLLVINGDVANTNWIILVVLDELSKYFKQILYVYGNHEYYLDTKNQIRKYKTSLKRLEELEEKAPSNVTFLKDFKEFVYQDKIFAGDISWYEIKEEDEFFFYNKSNDSSNIKGVYLQEQHQITLDNFNQLEKADVIITHIPPIFFHDGYHTNKSCYVSELPLEKTNLWLFGHTHLTDFEEIHNDIKFISHAVGYKEINIPLSEAKDNYKLYKQKRKKALDELLKQLKFITVEV